MARITSILREYQHKLLITSCSFLPRMRNVADKTCRENRNAQFIFKTIFFFNFENHAVHEMK